MVPPPERAWQPVRFLYHLNTQPRAHDAVLHAIPPEGAIVSWYERMENVWWQLSGCVVRVTHPMTPKDTAPVYVTVDLRSLRRLNDGEGPEGG